MLGLTELLIIVILLLFFLGGKKLPQLGENLGKGISEFKKSLRPSPTSPDAIQDENEPQGNNRPSKR